MRILVITSQFPIVGDPNRGRAVYQTVCALQRLADVQVVSPVATYPKWAQPGSYVYRPPSNTFRVGVKTEYVSYFALPGISRPFNGWLASRALRPVIRRLQPDVVLSYWLYPDAFGAWLAAQRSGIPIVVGARGSDIRVRDALSKRLTRYVVGRAQRVLTVSADLGRLAVDEYGASPNAVRVVPNGCDIEIFHPGDRRAARMALGIAADREVVLFVGRLVIEKGVRELIDAVRVLRASRPNLELVFVGEGPAKNELLVRASGLPIRFEGGQPPEKVAKWMTAANVAALPSYSEGHPNVLVEALACGRPVVACGVGGVLEIVDEYSGILVPLRDAKGLAVGLDAALVRNWDEGRLASRFSRSWAQVAEETLAVCAEVVGAPGARQCL